MSDEFGDAAEPDEAPEMKAREMLARRLADIVCLPGSRITPQERHIAADLLIDVLSESSQAVRLRCAQRISALSEAPGSVLRWLAADDPIVSAPVILDSQALTDADLAAIARAGGAEQRIQIAQRREVSSLVSEILVEPGEPRVMEAVLGNAGAALSEAAIDQILRVSRDHPHFARLLSRRDELKPGQGLTLFWWSDAATRKQLLLRFGVERHLLQEASSDAFAEAAAIAWSDPVTRKALQFIERRQRNRKAIERSPFDSLEAAVASIEETGFTRRLAEEISYLSGVKPATGARILTDLGGEPIAVLCKATGLKRASLDQLWRGLKRPITTSDAGDPVYEHVLDVFESLATDKAQTVLRYWNWSLTSAASPAQIMAEEDDAFAPDGMSAAERAARLVWGAGRWRA